MDKLRPENQTAGVGGASDGIDEAMPLSCRRRLRSDDKWPK